MSKRFTDTNKYKKAFFRGLKGAYKLLWDYLYHDCDHAGIWIKNFEIAQIYLGQDMRVNERDALKYFNNSEVRIIPFDNNEKWFIPAFIEFQYGCLLDELNFDNKMHRSVINTLKKYNLIKGYKSPLEGAKEKEQYKDKYKRKEKEEKFKEQFEPFLKKYSKEILNEFFKYWTEPNKSNTKLRWELEKTWDIGRRLARWASNDTKFEKKPESKIDGRPLTQEEMRKLQANE